MRKPFYALESAARLGFAVIILGWLAGSCTSRVPVEEVLAAYQETSAYPELKLRYPLEGTVFPPEIVPLPFSWHPDAAKSDTWLILFQFSNDQSVLHFVSQQTEWTPPQAAWEKIKQQSRHQPAKVTVLGFQRAAPAKILSRARITLSTSSDPVGAPLFYREVNLPFIKAVKDPSHIRWRFGSIDSPEPPKVVLEHLPVCGNCHSFSRDGGTLGMDVDYANNKGAYVVTRVAKEMVLASSEIISWNDYKKEDQQLTFGLLSQVSPDGRVVVSTVKDKSVFVEKPDLAFSQLFFPIKGILAFYRRETGTFHPLPGADDPEYVQSNPSWSPDGKQIVFARAKRYDLRNPEAQNKLLLSAEDCAEFLRDGKPFLFDLYRIPFNNGQGGQPEPLLGASRNGRSNFFAKYSPDGKWIIFCQAKSYMLLQPDSELYIIPAEGGEARRLECNLSRMNSWHSWSPNSRWLVFSSKANSPYTQLFLTHIDERGHSTPPVLLAHFTVPDRAANIPEFVHATPDAIVKIREQFLNDYSHARSAYVFESTGAIDRAIAEYQKALAINPKNVNAHQRLGFLLYHARKQFQEGVAHTREALRLDPNDGCAQYDLGMAYMHQQQIDPAIQHMTRALELLPDGFDYRYNVGDMSYFLATAWVMKGGFKQASQILLRAAAAAPKNADVHYLLALTLAEQGQIEAPLQYHALAKSLQPDQDKAPQYYALMANNFAHASRFYEALEYVKKAIELAQASGNAVLARELRERMENYRQAQ